MGRTDVTEVLSRGVHAAERILLRVEELELLVSADRPRRLIDLAQEELTAAVVDAARTFDNDGLEELSSAGTTTDPSVAGAWIEFKEMLTLSSRRASEASTLIATRLLAAQDALGALDGHREYGADGCLRLVRSDPDGGLLV
jgi:hypothetical protein